MGFFPFYTDIKNKKCLVVGGGNIAYRKIEKLMDFAPKITVVAPDICSEIQEIHSIEIIRRKFIDDDIENSFMVIGATDNNEVNSHISELCYERKIPVNIVDQPNLCSFYFPSIVRKNNLTVSISTEGKSPVLARYLREKIEAEIDDDILNTAEVLAAARKKIRILFNDEKNRKNALENILERCVNKEITDIDELEIYIEYLRKNDEN